MSFIRVSRNFGVNPSIVTCFFCQQPKNEVALLGHMSAARATKMLGPDITNQLHGYEDDVEAPHNITLDREPCDKCKEYMKKGVLLISVDEQHSPDRDNPYRTGGWVVVTEDFIKRVCKSEELIASLLKTRVGFMPDEVWDHLGLPRGEQPKKAAKKKGKKS